MITNKRINRIISESIYKVIKESEDGNKKIVDLISFLHNAQLPVREIHWNTRRNSLHLLTDEILDSLLEWEDTLAESYLGDIDNANKLNINQTKPSKNNKINDEIKIILKELIELTSEIKNQDNKAIAAVIDDILEKSNKYIYRANFI